MVALLTTLAASVFAGSGEEQASETSAAQPVYEEISSSQAAKIAKDPNVFILDVRTPAEYAAGHITDATLLPVQDLASRISEISQYKDTEILVYCRSGNRSTTASQILMNAGFTNIKNLKYGLIEWAGEGLPLTTE